MIQLTYDMPIKINTDRGMVYGGFFSIEGYGLSFSDTQEDIENAIRRAERRGDNRYCMLARSSFLSSNPEHYELEREYEESCVLIEEGKYYMMGGVPRKAIWKGHCSDCVEFLSIPEERNKALAKSEFYSHILYMVDENSDYHAFIYSNALDDTDHRVIIQRPEGNYSVRTIEEAKHIITATDDEIRKVEPYRDVFCMEFKSFY